MSKTAKKGLLALLLLAVLAVAAAGAYFSYSFFMKQAYPLKYRDIIETQAEKYSIDPAFLYGMIRTESNFNPDAESSAGARGLMQIMPSTGEWIAGKLDEAFDAQRLYEPSVYLRYGCWYLRFLLDRYDGDMRTALTAYHQGQGRVDEWLQDPEYSEDGKTLSVISSSVTDTYVNRIMENYAHYQELY